MKLCIAEEALINRDGHWFEYLNTISREFRKSGDTVKIAANKDATEDILSTLNADPVFPESVWGKSRSDGFPFTRFTRLWTHNRNLYRAANAYIKKQESIDVLFVPTILIDHILGWRKFIKKNIGKNVKKVVLFFVNGQGTYNGPGQPIFFNKTPNKLLFKKALESLKPQIQDGSVLLGCETREMAREYEEFCGLPFEYLPHPVDEVEIDMQNDSGNYITISHLGFSRYEKGSDLIQKAIKRYLKLNPATKVRFVLQWVTDFHLEDGTLCIKDPALVESPNVEYITTSLGSEEYTKLLAQTDIMLLPYRLRAYYARVSRVAIEAAINSIPMIYTKDSWNESLVTDGHGSGVGFESENDESLYKAIEEAVNSYSELKVEAEKNRKNAFEHYSANTFQNYLKFMTGHIAPLKVSKAQAQQI